jgi:amidase
MEPMQVATRRISRDCRRYSFNSHDSPVGRIEPGESLEIETHDARSGSIRRPTDLLDKPPPGGFNPITGPIFVNGAEPGDSLLVLVKKIELASQGFTAVKAKVGLLGERATQFKTRIIPIERGWCQFSEHLRFPIRPMIGTIGVAPASGEIAALYPGPHGGNMDNNEVRTGCTVHLPVQVTGGLLSIGDVHASMGDGEVTMLALEIPAVVTVTVTVQKAERASRPWIETDDGRWITTGDDLDTATAMRIACDEMVNLLMKKLSLSFEDAYMLASVRADLRICQSCDPGKLPVTTRMEYQHGLRV